MAACNFTGAGPKTLSTSTTPYSYEALLLFGGVIRKDSDGVGHSSMRSLGCFSSRQAAERAAQKALQKATGAAGTVIRKARQ